MRHRCMNSTKWEELRLAMASVKPSPGWKVVLLNGFESSIDHEWFYHFAISGHNDTHYVDIFPSSPEQHLDIGRILREIHLPGIETTYGYRVYGYMEPYEVIDYL